MLLIMIIVTQTIFRRCAKSKDESCFTYVFKACDVCYDKIRSYRESTKERIIELNKARYQANREAEIARHTKYREDHREYLCEKISCPICKKLVTRCDIAQPKRGKTCMKAGQEEQAQQSEELRNEAAVL